MHLIRRQRWVVRTASPEQAFAVRKLLNDRWEEAILPAFSRAFDQAQVGTTIVRIPRLEISLRLTSVDRLTDVLPDAIFRLLRDHLVEAGESKPTEDNWFEALVEYLKTG